MPTQTAAAAPADPLALLERAIGYTRPSLQLVTDEAMARPTPCRGWDLRALLCHLSDSLAALQEAVEIGYVDLHPARGTGPTVAGTVSADGPRDLVATVRSRACSLLGAWTHSAGATLVSVAGRPLATDLLAGTGALEIAVHGWDVARACGGCRPLPPLLAEELLELAPLVVTDHDRPARFAAPVGLPSCAAPGDRLLAFLGRRPSASPGSRRFPQ